VLLPKVDVLSPVICILPTRNTLKILYTIKLVTIVFTVMDAARLNRSSEWDHDGCITIWDCTMVSGVTLAIQVALEY
jgi:hypothetical protein